MCKKLKLRVIKQSESFNLKFNQYKFLYLKWIGFFFQLSEDLIIKISGIRKGVLVFIN